MRTLETVRAIRYAGEKKSSHCFCVCECVNCNTNLKHENINKEEALVQEFMPYVVHIRAAMGSQIIADLKFALAEQKHKIITFVHLTEKGFTKIPDTNSDKLKV